VKKCLLTVLFFCSTLCYAQVDTSVIHSEKPIHNPNFTARRWLVGGLSATAFGGSFTFLNSAWYEDYPKTSFHTFNDIGEWKQVDKVGHAWTAYHTSRLTTSLWKWAGVNEKTAVLLGTGSSYLYMLSIEYLDGRSQEWGWSWGDVGANTFGAALFAGQQLAFHEQKVSLKFSSHLKDYNEPALKKRADNLYGKSLPERLLKDYNAQTYWLSANIKSIFPSTKIPEWLNVSVGYGAKGMFGGYVNLAYNEDGLVWFDRTDIKRYRQWYLAPDVDLTKIKTRSKFLRTVFSALNVLKFPSPALEFSNGKFKLKALAF